MTKTKSQNNSAFFRPPKKQRSEEEKLCIRILWDDSEKEIKQLLLEELQREPTEEEVNVMFKRLIKAMKKEGHIQGMIDRYQKAVADEKAADLNSNNEQEMRIEVEPKNS